MPDKTVTWQQKIGINTYDIQAQRTDGRTYYLYKEPDEIGWHTLPIAQLTKRTREKLALKAEELLGKDEDKEPEK